MNMRCSRFHRLHFRVLSCCPKRLTNIHSHTDGGGCHARCRPARQEQFRVQCCPRTHADQVNRTSNLPITRCWLYTSHSRPRLVSMLSIVKHRMKDVFLNKAAKSDVIRPRLYFRASTWTAGGLYCLSQLPEQNHKQQVFSTQTSLSYFKT